MKSRQPHPQPPWPEIGGPGSTPARSQRFDGEPGSTPALVTQQRRAASAAGTRAVDCEAQGIGPRAPVMIRGRVSPCADALACSIPRVSPAVSGCSESSVGFLPRAGGVARYLPVQTASQLCCLAVRRKGRFRTAQPGAARCGHGPRPLFPVLYRESARRVSKLMGLLCLRGCLQDGRSGKSMNQMRTALAMKSPGILLCLAVMWATRLGAQTSPKWPCLVTGSMELRSPCGPRRPLGSL